VAKSFLVYKIVLGALLGVLFLSLFAAGAYAAVTLVDFRTIPGDGYVILLWETATELDNVGFFINRSNQQTGTYERINENIIPSRGDGLTGDEYEYRDSDVVNGNEYWYRLESIDSGQQSQFYEPVPAVPGATATPSPSVTVVSPPTATSDLSATASTTSIPDNTLTPTSAAGSQPTVTPALPGSTPYPGPATSTNNPGSPADTTGTALALENQQAGTATLVPFPTVTIRFPATNTPERSTFGQAQNGITLEEDSSSSGIVRLWPLGMLVFIWIIIGVWFLVTRQHT
jgi:hypothetical protein